tara:strand:- start:204 stop:845 length:642 start_codon:yes stop_codon:yes gene_type:complete
MEENLLHIPQMILIGSSGRNSGKTTLAIALIKRWKRYFPVVGLKVTTIQDRDGACPRGGKGCGVCNSLNGDYEILEEINRNLDKDTSLLLAAGADKVYWLKTLKSNIGDGIAALMQNIPANTIIVCESNSLRMSVKPGVFIMLDNSKDGQIKESAMAVMDKADIIIDYDFKECVNSIIEKIQTNEIQQGLSMKLINGEERNYGIFSENCAISS